MTGTPTANGSLAFKAPSYQDYNFSVQSEVMPNTVFEEIGYVGTKGTPPPRRHRPQPANGGGAYGKRTRHDA